MSKINWTKFVSMIVLLMISANVFIAVAKSAVETDSVDLQSGFLALAAVIIIGAFVWYAFRKPGEHFVRHMLIVIIWLCLMLAFGILVLIPHLNWGSVRSSVSVITIIFMWLGLALFAVWEIPDKLKEWWVRSRAKKAEQKLAEPAPKKRKVKPHAKSEPDFKSEDDDGIIDAVIVEDDPLDP